MVLTLSIGGTLLKALRRATRRANFEAQVTFEGPEGPSRGEAPHRTYVTYEAE